MKFNWMIFFLEYLEYIGSLYFSDGFCVFLFFFLLVSLPQEQQQKILKLYVKYFHEIIS